MREEIKSAILQLAKRAEVYEPEYLKATFVDMESMLTSIKTKDHQIIFGRRGTGKTHFIRMIKEYGTNDYAIYIDLRTIGSTGGIYNDNQIPIAERATRLVLDVLGAVHDSFYYYAITSPEANLDSWNVALDNFASSITEVNIIGEKTVTISESNERKKTVASAAGISVSTESAGADLSINKQTEKAEAYERTFTSTGKENYRIHFGNLQNSFKGLIPLMNGKQIKVLIDEWSEIPLDLQPLLADLIKRTLLPVPGITVKIAAIEKRSRFNIDDLNRTGIEIGADIPSIIDLDDYLVFDNNPEKSTRFFMTLISNHVRNIMSENGNRFTGSNEELINNIFNRSDTLSEFTKASEGVPRDAINILTNCCVISKDDKITIPDVRLASKRWYNIGKETSLVNPRAKKLLRWIIDIVISHRKARAFLLNGDTPDKLIDQLYDSRLIHIIKKSVSSNENPGERFIVYSIDYGCYVDLINTVKEPLGLFEIETDDESSKYIEVPSNDYRSIRRAILNLEEFYRIQT